jgi:hypothetical protein
MSPKSLFLFKKNVYLKVGAFLLIIPTILVLTFTQNKPVADAQIASLYASTCLGGWKDVDKVTGVPEVAGDASVEYSEKNSATLYNKQTQIYCGGFTGQIPDGVNRTKVALRFSWGVEGVIRDTAPQRNNQETNSVGNTTTIESDTASGTSETGGEIQSDNSQSVEPAQEEEVPVEAEQEPTTESESVSWWRHVVPQAFAQGEVTEDASPLEEAVVEPASSETVQLEEATTDQATSTDESKDEEMSLETDEILASSTASSSATSTQRSYVSPIFDENTSKDNALFEVLFTLDNENWYPLGYVSRINNDIQFELPLELFTSVEDFNKLQISLKTVERFDEIPKIYLDSMWIEVSYLGVDEDPLAPPGTRSGDVIMSSVSTPETTLVTVFRGVKLETLSNITSLPASTTATSTASTTPAQIASTEARNIATGTPLALSSPSATSTASTSIPIVTFESEIPLEIRKELRATPGVEVEVWLYDRLTDAWTRVADNSSTATVPKAVLLDNKVFWFGPENTSLWMFDTVANSYSSRSLSVIEPVEIEFINSAGAVEYVQYNIESKQLERKGGVSSSSVSGV